MFNMKKALFDAREPLDPTVAWSCLVTNLLVLPGLGTLVARRWEGFVQAAMALAGFALTLAWLVSFVATWIRLRTFPFEGGPSLLWGVLGVLLFLLAWLWGLASSLAIVRKVRTSASRVADK